MARFSLSLASLASLSLFAACASEPDYSNIQQFQDPLTVCADGPTVSGIDVSYYQGTIDWNAVKASGIDFAFIRVSDGLGFEDPKFQQNWDNAASAGVLRGVYQFFRPASDPIAQADLLLEKMGPLGENDLPPVIDVEAVDGRTPAQISEAVGLWIQRIESATGRQPIVYTGKYFWNDNVKTDAFSSYPLWIAQYGPVCPDLPIVWSDWTFFQTSSSGQIPGISGNVDTNLFNGSLADLINFTGFSAVCGDGTCSPTENSDNCLADCAPCATIAGEETIINEDSSCFTGGGPVAFLRSVSDAGYAGDLIWTHTTSGSSEANFGEWSLFFSEAGTYRVEVFTDAAYAQSKTAKYKVKHNGSTSNVTLNQTSANGWQSLGEFDFAAGGLGQLVHVGDNTGEPGSTNTQLVFDAVRLTKIVPPDPNAIPEDTTDENNFESGSIFGGCAVNNTSSDSSFGMIVLSLGFLGLVLRRRTRR